MKHSKSDDESKYSTYGRHTVMSYHHVIPTYSMIIEKVRSFAVPAQKMNFFVVPSWWDHLHIFHRGDNRQSIEHAIINIIDADNKTHNKTKQVTFYLYLGVMAMDSLLS